MARVTSARFALKAIVNVGPYESLQFDYEENVEFNVGDDVSRIMAAARKRVNHTIEEEVLKARRDVAAAKRRTSSTEETPRERRR